MDVIVKETEAMQKEVDNVIAEMQRMTEAESAPEPGTLNEKDVISDGLSEDQPFPAVVAKVKSAGYVKIYNSQTGESSLTNRNMLATQREKRFPDGSRVWSLVPPRDAKGNLIQPVRGQLRCMLHKDDPNRPQYDQWRLPYCPKDNLASEQDVIDHMKHRHKREWATIDGERERRERAEDREIQRQQAAAMMAALKAATNPAAVEAEPEAPVKRGPFGRPLKST